MKDLVSKLQESAATANKSSASKSTDSKASKDSKASNASASKDTAQSKVQTKEAYALMSTPSGKALFTYMLAVLSFAGMFTSGRKAADKKAVSSMFRSATAITHHTKNGNIEETKAGKIRLTVTGWNYFQGRLTGSTVGQTVDQKEVDALVAAIKSGKLDKATARFGTDTKFRKVDLPA